MTLSKTEKKDIADKVDKILDKFYDSVFVAVDDIRYNADMSKKEITEILIRDLKMGITESFKKSKFAYEVNLKNIMIKNA